MKLTPIHWVFPLRGPHQGLPFGNGRTGLLVWGYDNRLILTIGRADLWDHRGGMVWTKKQNFQDIFAALKAKDQDALKSIFETETEHTAGQPPRPSVIPVGRFRLTFPDAVKFLDADLDLSTATGVIRYEKHGVSGECVISLSPVCDRFLLETEEVVQMESIPAYDLVDLMAKYSFREPIRIRECDAVGWIQEMPSDPHVGCMIRQKGGLFAGVVERAENAEALKTQLQKLSESLLESPHPQHFRQETARFWREFWGSIPQISMENKRLESLYYFGLYRFESYANPKGKTPGSLQGPWIEDHRMPPWSSDYHFNINVQLCYSPAYAAGRYEELKLLFDMILSWKPQLRKNAECFIGIPDGYMLPHAVDDHCVCMGGFWSGTVDHACTAWVAMMMNQYVRFSGDLDFLRDQAFDFMKGAFCVYYAMMERAGDGTLSLPLSTSPEYLGDYIGAWGRNASFQLAACHNLCNNLIDAAKTLQEEPDPRWLEVVQHLPKVTIGKDERGREEIYLWEGQRLDNSHRHHSHLGAVVPFDIIQVEDPAWTRLIDMSFYHLSGRGTGLWAGWSIPWAAMLHSHVNNPRMAELLLTAWESVFTNKGHASVHNYDVPGFSAMGDRMVSQMGGEAPLNEQGELIEIMQVDGAMGAVNAIQDMFLHTRTGVLYVGRGIPPSWAYAAVEDMPTSLGVHVSVSVEYGSVTKLSMVANRKTTVRMASPWKSGAAVIRSSSRPHLDLEGPVLTFDLSLGETARIIPR